MTDGQYRIIWPSFKLPRRPYPVFVYLCAAALYLSSGESMRATAEKTSKTFGLGAFSHSTISRFLNQNIPDLALLARLWSADRQRLGRW
ncbi:MAG: hypothetical protein AB1815_09905 [Bacillota bacterium]